MSKYHQEIGAKTYFKNSMMKYTKGLGQKYLKRAMTDLVLFGSWFSSKKLEEGAIDIGSDINGTV